VVYLVAQPCLAVERCDVVDDVHSGRGALNRDGIDEVALDVFDALGRAVAVEAPIPTDERADVIAARGKCPRQVAPGEAGGAGD